MVLIEAHPRNASSSKRAAGWPLRRAVLVALAVFTGGTALTAPAPTCPTVLASRGVAAIGAALYTASATSSAAALAGEARRGRAIAIVMFGLPRGPARRRAGNRD
jgi:MFS transporter, DHA1 family, inner membrane transport protein